VKRYKYLDKFEELVRESSGSMISEALVRNFWRFGCLYKFSEYSSTLNILIESLIDLLTSILSQTLSIISIEVFSSLILALVDLRKDAW